MKEGSGGVTRRRSPRRDALVPTADVRFVDLPGTMNTGWKAAGFDNGLAKGAPIACDLHPDCARAGA